MFEGPIGKKMMIEQGYVPATCVMHEAIAGVTIYVEVSAGRDPCSGCNAGGDRSVCHGRPRADAATAAEHSAQRMREFLGHDPGSPEGDKAAQVMVLVEKDLETTTRKIWAMWDASDPVAVGITREKRAAEERAEQRRRDAESEAISGRIYGLDEPVEHSQFVRCDTFDFQYRCTEHLNHRGDHRFWMDSGEVYTRPITTSSDAPGKAVRKPW